MNQPHLKPSGTNAGANVDTLSLTLRVCGRTLWKAKTQQAISKTGTTIIESKYETAKTG